MKKILLTASVAALIFNACDLDINDDPNYPSEDNITAELIFPAIEGSIAACVGGDIYNYAGFFAQYFEQMPEANQYNMLATYSFREASQELDYSYGILFAGALTDAKQVLEKSTNPADRFATTVLRAYIYQFFVDNTSDAPYTEALQGANNPTPKWDKGEDVYKGILNELDLAEQELGANPAMDSPDLVCDRNMSQWIGFANALRLRMYLRFIDANVEANAYIEKVKSLVQANKFFTGDIKFDAFRNEVNYRNPWYTTTLSTTGNHCGSYPLISYLSHTNDPRIAFGILKATANNEYAGAIPGSHDEAGLKNANVSAIDISIASAKPVYFFTQSELQFLIAEVYVRFLNNDVAAKSAYEAAIDADFSARQITGASAMYGTGGSVAWANAASNDAKLELIYMQKWVALFYMDHMEAWSEIRRTDCPKLSTQKASAIFESALTYTPGELITPWINGIEAGGLIKRMFYPLSARQQNVNTPEAVPASTPVWWDVK